MREDARPPGRLGRTLPALVSVAALTMAASAATAQEAPGDGPAGLDLETGALATLSDLFMNSWITVGITGAILVLSILALMLLLYFLATINSRAMVPADLVDELTKLVLRGKYEAASDLCRANRRVFIATIVQRCVENAGKGHSVIMDMIDSEGRRRADIVWNRISYLADVSNVAPMLGLLGTVIGMIMAFFGLEHQSGTVDAAALSQGVATAMGTTLLGLSVGILATIFYSIVKSRATRTLAEAEAAVHSIADHLKRGEGDHARAPVSASHNPAASPVRQPRSAPSSGGYEIDEP
ncbi:MAG: MotA/TolQ/ExbB proton channel family protein [Phycisphaeraceae bacterium]